MAILRCDQQIRLTGDDAEHYLNDTGRARLPVTVSEYNRALQDAIQAWVATDCDEGRLLAVLIEARIIE